MYNKYYFIYSTNSPELVFLLWKQKIDGKVYGVGADIHHKNSEYRVTYEYATSDTIQPPLDKNLKNNKLFTKYSFNLKDNFGNIYGAGLSYAFSKSFTTNLTQDFITKVILNLIIKLKLNLNL